MLVYKLRHDSNHYVGMTPVNEKDVASLQELSQPRALAAHWRPLPMQRLRWDNDEVLEEGDVALLFSTCGLHLAFTTRAMKLVADVFEKYGEFLPVQLEQEYWHVYHCLNQRDALDIEASTGVLLSKEGVPISVRELVFKDEIIRDQWLFTIPHPWPSAIYATEDVRGLVNRFGLSGVLFRPVSSQHTHAVRAAKDPGGDATIHEAALNTEERAHIAHLVHEGLRLLPQKYELDTQAEHILGAVDKVVAGKVRVPAKSESSSDHVAALACVFGQIICRVVGWEWVRVQVGEDARLAIVPPMRAHLLIPQEFVQRQMEKKVEPKCLLVFNMIRSGALPASGAFEYLSIV
jgi:hypothetical protein